MNKKELRDKFFKEHTYKCENGIPRVVTHPHNLFEWIYEQLIIPYVVVPKDTFNCDVEKGTKCANPNLNYKNGLCLNCGGY